MICTQTAWTKFEGIVNIIGGENEKSRAAELQRRLRIVQDELPQHLKQLKGPKIQDIHRIIFGTGELYKAVTTTANISFVRSAEQQGFKFATFVHPGRALTERKRELPIHQSN